MWVITGMKQSKIKIIGLTGNSGSGKTTCSEILKEQGCFIINCDKIARDVLNINEECYFHVISHFGENILNIDKTINRKKLGEIVFKDKAKLDLLTEITHKYIIKIVIDKVNYVIEKDMDFKYIIIDAPLLINTPLMEIVDQVWVVYAPIENSLERIIKRDSLEITQAKNRIMQQLPYEVLFKHADKIIYNNGNIEDLKKVIFESLHQEMPN